MPIKDLDKLLLQMEKLPRWQLWVFRIFMELHQLYRSLARRLGLIKPNNL